MNNTETNNTTSTNLPRIIQGGMGAGISSWILANAVSRNGHLGVVSGTALDVLFARRLQDGDVGGHMRRAANAFPIREIAERVLERYYIPGGKQENEPYKTVPMHSVSPSSALTELTILGNFAEVYLAKENHSGVVGINYLEKIQLPTLPSLFGAMLAGVDYVLMGAGIPRSIPGILDNLADGKPVRMRVDIKDAPNEYECFTHFEPSPYLNACGKNLKRPMFLAIISSVTLALTLAKKSDGKVNGFVVEGPSAGGHNAPPRGGIRNLTEAGEPVYGAKDEVDIDKIKDIGLPFWLAGSYAEPEKLSEALSLGSSGVQIGTAFAFCEESGMSESIKRKVIEQSIAGTVKVFTDPYASPTGFPIKVLEFENSVSDKQLYEARKRICDLGFLRQPYLKDNGTIDYRCPGEPQLNYVRKQGDCDDCTNRKCLCNGLMATAGFAQIDKSGTPELPLVTAGLDAKNICRFLKPGKNSYTAEDVINYMMQGC